MRRTFLLRPSESVIVPESDYSNVVNQENQAHDATRIEHFEPRYLAANVCS